MSNELHRAMAEVNDLNRTHGVVQRGGKKYTEVSVRLEAFRKHLGLVAGIETHILQDTPERVVVKAQITDAVTGRVLGTGHAEEFRNSSNVNKTSAIENAETSAIGRALASIGLHGGSYASANEMAAIPRKESAIESNQQTQAPAQAPVQQYTQDDNKARARAWAAKAMAEITACNSIPALRAWDAKNDAAVEKLRAAYPDLFNELLNHYSTKEGSLNAAA